MNPAKMVVRQPFLSTRITLKISWLKLTLAKVITQFEDRLKYGKHLIEIRVKAQSRHQVFTVCSRSTFSRLIMMMMMMMMMMMTMMMLTRLIMMMVIIKCSLSALGDDDT